jgi:colanic acid/amylovoran biosynthesis glycosyltransferase
VRSLSNLIVLHFNPIWLQQTQTWIHSQVAGLQSLGVKIHIVCEYKANLDQFNLDNIHCLADESWIKQKTDRWLQRLGIRNHLKYLVEVGRQTEATVIHSHFGDIAWKNLGAVRCLGVKHVVTFYGYDVNYLPKIPVWKKRYRQLFDEADLFLCEGSHMAKCIVDLGCPEYKVKVQHLGVDVNRFEFKPRHWLQGMPLKVLIAASFREKKGILYAIEALGLIQKETPIELTIIGDAGVDIDGQRLKVAILQMIETVGLKFKTRLLGYQPHSVMLQEAYSHHILLQPSVTASNGDTEGGAPVSIIEMLATGMPVVSTTHCDIPEVAGQELRHLLAPERNVDELVRIIRQLIKAPDDWVSIASKGRDRVVSEYDQQIQAQRQRELYLSINAAEH